MDAKQVIDRVIEETRYGYTARVERDSIVVRDKKGKLAGTYSNGQYASQPGFSMFRDRVRAALAAAAKEAE